MLACFAEEALLRFGGRGGRMPCFATQGLGPLAQLTGDRPGFAAGPGYDLVTGQGSWTE